MIFATLFLRLQQQCVDLHLSRIRVDRPRPAFRERYCGIISDGCGDVVDCGFCNGTAVCGGAGVANVCGCLPESCEQLSVECGPTTDNCGNALDCGDPCPAPESCGGGGVVNVCGVPGTGPFDLSGVVGCEGVFNPSQILDYHLTLPAGDWSAVLADDPATDPEVARQAQFHCNDEPPILVSIHRKRGGGTTKVGLKIDINAVVANQTYYGLKNLVLDNSVGCCEASDGDAGDMLREYLAWQMMRLSGTVSSRFVFVNLYVNGELLGVIGNVEAVDKVFLDDRFADDSGWLYKKSGGPGGGLKTHESDGPAGADPYDDYFCFWSSSGGGPDTCATPADVAATLSEHLMLDQMLRFGAVNAMVANSDSPIFKDNNYYYYDWPGTRAYLPWDLDTCMKDLNTSVFDAGSSKFVSVLFPTWEDDYDQILTALLSEPLTLAAIHQELDRVLAVTGAAISADPFLSASPADEIESLKTYWATRHAAVTAQVQGH